MSNMISSIIQSRLKEPEKRKKNVKSLTEGRARDHIDHSSKAWNQHSTIEANKPMNPLNKCNKYNNLSLSIIITMSHLTTIH